jgi:hypothetical protein
MKIIATAASNFNIKEESTVDRNPEVDDDFMPEKSK